MGTTKSKTSNASVVESLQAELAALQQRIAALTSEKLSVTAEAVRRFTVVHWVTLQAAMIVDGTTYGEGFGIRAKGKLRPDRKGYLLRKGVDPKFYMACKGFANTLRSRHENGLPIELSATPNEKGRTQVQYAQEMLSGMVEAGLIAANSPLLTGTPAKARSKKNA